MGAATESKPQTPAEIRALAAAWYQQQIARTEKCLGTFWPEHREWIESYLKEELKQKLIERGWRLKS